MPLKIVDGIVIKAGESASSPIDCSGGDLVRITMPTGWTDAPLTFGVSTDGVFFNDLVDFNGDEVAMPTVVPGSAVPVLNEGNWTRILGFLQLKSGTRDAPVPQEEDRQFAVTVETAPQYMPA